MSDVGPNKARVFVLQQLRSRMIRRTGTFQGRPVELGEVPDEIALFAADELEALWTLDKMSVP